MDGKLVRCMGAERTTFALPLKVVNYKLDRLVFLKEDGPEAF
jgi:hypothetical protein